MRLDGSFYTCVAIAAGALAFAASPLDAATLDPVGDFLPTFVGPQNGDLDVTSVEARIVGPGAVLLTAQHAGAIGTTAGSSYVWGVDRGQGQAFLTFNYPSVGAGVTFDAVAVLLADGTGFVLDVLAGTPPTLLDPGAVSISGGSISVTLSEALLPSTGFAFGGYGYNLWPRFAPGGVDPADNTQVSDFAPDASVIAPVPVPASLGLSLVGLGLLAASRHGRAGRAPSRAGGAPLGAPHAPATSVRAKSSPT